MKFYIYFMCALLHLLYAALICFKIEVSLSLPSFLPLSLYIYIHIYIYMHICIYVYV